MSASSFFPEKDKEDPVVQVRCMFTLLFALVQRKSLSEGHVCDFSVHPGHD